MPLLGRRAKACFQFAKATVPEAWAHLRHEYHGDAAFLLARKKIGLRLSKNTGRLNFIMAVPIVNWEKELIQHAQAHGDCHHINFEARDFFDSVGEWRQYRADNLAKLISSFEQAYRAEDVNILFLYLSEFHIEPGGLEFFKKRNVIIVNFNWDDRLHYSSSHNGQSVGVRGIAKVVDINLTMALGPMSRYASDGAAVFYWRGSENTVVNAPILPELEFERVLFFGSKYGFREELIEYLIRKGLPLDVYGSGWGSEFIPYHLLQYKIPRYALNLGVSSIGYTRRLVCVKGRDIEVPLAGGLYITTHSREIMEIYRPGKDILTFRAKNDCYRLACEVLDNPSRFAGIRINGAMQAQFYSWDSRFLYLTELVSIILSTHEEQ